MILITGDLGFIGSRLVPKIKGGAGGIDLRAGRNLLTCKLPNPADVHTVYHLAAQSSVEPSWQDPLHDLDNIRITARLVHAFPHAKIIYANSSAATEKPQSPYGFSKKASGEYIKLFHNNYVICTLPNVYGEEGGKSVVDIFKERDHVTIFGDGLQVRDYVHVDDIVEAFVKAKDWPKGEYTLGSGKGTTVLELAKGKNIRFETARKEEREVILPNTTPDWKPEIDVIEYIHAL